MSDTAGPFKNCSASPFFLAGSRGSNFCLWITPGSNNRITSAAIHVAAFGEEMNKSRRLVANQARALAELGIASLIFDFYGTGDSDGELIDADWKTWLSDIDCAARWVQNQGIGNISIWGNRLGAALAIEYSLIAEFQIDTIILWQPVWHGEKFVRQFLRLQRASEMIQASAESNGDVGDMGKSDVVEIAGYHFTETLRQEVSQVRADLLVPNCSRVGIFEVTALEPPRLSRTSAQVTSEWLNNGVPVLTCVVRGEPFWSTTEIVSNDTLLNETGIYLARGE